MLIVGQAANHELGLAAVVGGFDDTAISFEQRVSGVADAFVGIDHQDAAADEQRTRLAANCGRLGLGRGHGLPYFLNHLLDIAGVPQNLL